MSTEDKFGSPIKNAHVTLNYYRYRLKTPNYHLYNYYIKKLENEPYDLIVGYEKNN